MRLLTRLLVVVAALVDLAACGGGGSHGSTNDPGGGAGGGGGGGGGMTQTFAVGGTVANLAGSGLILQNNLGDDLTVPTSGPFTFSMPVASGAAYSVTVKAQPTNPDQICSVSNGSGVSTAIVTSVAVTCATSPSGAFSVGGTVMGLVGAVTLTNTLGGGQSEDLTQASNGGFTFPTAIASGAGYSV